MLIVDQSLTIFILISIVFFSIFLILQILYRHFDIFCLWMLMIFINFQYFCQQLFFLCNSPQMCKACVHRNQHICIFHRIFSVFCFHNFGQFYIRFHWLFDWARFTKAQRLVQQIRKIRLIFSLIFLVNAYDSLQKRKRFFVLLKSDKLIDESIQTLSKGERLGSSDLLKSLAILL